MDESFGDILSQFEQTHHAEESGTVEGTVVSVDKTKQEMTVNSKEIPGFMPAMVMPYPVATEDGAALNQVDPGDQITAEVAVDEEGARLHDIAVAKKAEAGGAVAARSSATPKQDTVPDFTLLNQDGKQIHLSDYHGKTLLLTFIYTRCPLPDQCPLATHNFASIEKSLAKNAALYGKTHLLSVSFDSDYDTPAVLRNYARLYGQDHFDHWEFATLPAGQIAAMAGFFDIFVHEQQGQISHSMCAAVIGPDGMLYRVYPGNEWKASALLADISALVAKPAAGARTSNPQNAAVREVAALH